MIYSLVNLRPISDFRAHADIKWFSIWKTIFLIFKLIIYSGLKWPALFGIIAFCNNVDILCSRGMSLIAKTTTTTTKCPSACGAVSRNK